MARVKDHVTRRDFEFANEVYFFQNRVHFKPPCYSIVGRECSPRWCFDYRREITCEQFVCDVSGPFPDAVVSLAPLSAGNRRLFGE